MLQPIVLIALLLWRSDGFVPSFPSNNNPLSRTVDGPATGIVSLSSTVESSDDAVTEPGSSSVDADHRHHRLELLDDAIQEFNSSSAAALVQELTQMRANGTSQSIIDTVLNDMLGQGPDRKLPLWARLRFVSRWSKRARLASLRRTLDLTTPPPNAEDDEQDSLEDQQRRRRRALVSLLRQLAAPAEETIKGPAIVALERKARREQRANRRGEDLTLRRPEGLETPKYDVVIRYPSYEIRRYEPFSVCSVSMRQPRPVDAYTTDATVSDPQMGGARAFGALAGYLFGKNQQKSAMAMTTPVLTRESVSDKEMSFILPSDYWQENGLTLAPQPLDGSGVKLERNDGGERAVVMFGGYASKKDTEARTKQLLDALAKDKDWQRVQEEPVTLSQYNDPFTPPWKRLNEVSVAVRPRK